MIAMAAYNALDFAYRYPFSEEAKSAVRGVSPDQGKQGYLDIAAAMVGEALKKGIIEYKNISYGKLENVIGYVYSRLLISAIGDAYLIDKYAVAVAKRSTSAMMDDRHENIIKIASELGLKAEISAIGFSVKVIDFLEHAPSMEGFSAANYAFDRGRVMLPASDIAMFLEGVMAVKVKQGLPIPKGDIPKFVVAYAAGMSRPKQERQQGSGTRGWIEKLLEHPIPDVRQRAVGLILAPYLVNVKKLDVDAAYKVVLDYINRCRTLESSTKITDSQIMYYCKYAKQKGTRPMSLAKAREMFSGVIDFDSL